MQSLLLGHRLTLSSHIRELFRLERTSGDRQVQPRAEMRVSAEFRPGPSGLFHLQGQKFHIISGQPALKFDCRHCKTAFPLG